MLASGCGRHARVAPALRLDAQMAPAEQSLFEQPFEDGPASIRLGAGWKEREEEWPGSGRHGIAWAEGAARIYFGVPLAPVVDLVAIGVPLVFPGSPRQTLTPVLNGRGLGTYPMPRDWTELRIPLPAAALASPINILDMHFAYQAVPAKVGIPGGDVRTLAAAFDLLAVVPHGEPLPAERSAIEPAGSNDRKLLLRGEPIALPLPPARRIEVELGSVHATDPRQHLGIDLLTSDGTRQRLWEGAATAAADRTFIIGARYPRPERLLLQAEGGGTQARSATDTILMDPPEIEACPVAERPAGRPDIWIYLIDTLRADALGIYGAARPTSPRIDNFSRDAVVFEKASSPSSWTLPATFSVLSGLYPSHHGVVLPGDRFPADRQPWLPTMLAQQGYETLGISQWMLGGDSFGLERGFESFYLDVREAGKNPSATVRWFLWRHLLQRRHPDRPLFAYVHVVDPHALYRPKGDDLRFAQEHPGTLPPQLYDPNLFVSQRLGSKQADVDHLRALYDGEVHAADREFGAFVNLLKFFGVYDESLIVVLGDHGEEFNEHGGFDHGRTLYEELLRVPLIVKLPHSSRAGSRVGEPVSLLDIAPTIAELAGTSAAGFDGASLQRAGSGAPRPLFAETRVDALNLKAAKLGPLKCIENIGGLDRFLRPAPLQVFDLARDPRELVPLSPSADGFERCRTLLRQWLPGRGASAVLQPRPLSPADRARLRALGYIR